MLFLLQRSVRWNCYKLYKGREVFLLLLPDLFGKLISLYSFLLDCKLRKVDTAISENSLLVGFCHKITAWVYFKKTVYLDKLIRSSVYRQGKCRILLMQYFRRVSTRPLFEGNGPWSKAVYRNQKLSLSITYVEWIHSLYIYLMFMDAPDS